VARKPVKKRLRSSTGNSGKTVGPKKRGRVENLKPFLPGTSGNPEGRPKTAALSAACRDKLAHLVPDDPHGRTYAQVIADRLGELAIAGNISAAQELADRAEGRPRQTTDTTAHVQLSTDKSSYYDTLTDSELKERRLALLKVLESEGPQLPEEGTSTITN